MMNKLWKWILLACISISMIHPVYAQDTSPNIVENVQETSTLEIKEDDVLVYQEATRSQTRSMIKLEAGDLLDFGTGLYIYEYGMNSVTIEHNGKIDRAILMEMYLNGERVFCIEPEIHTSAGESYQPGFIDGILTYEEQRTLGLISYFGYGYRGDYSKEMSAATMIAVWLARGRHVYDVQDGVMQKVREIQNRVARVDIKPSFINQTLVFKGYGKNYAITLNDVHHVLEDYRVYDDGGYMIEQTGNSLKVWLEQGKKGNGKIVLDRIPRESQGSSIVYVNSSDYQKVMRIYPQSTESEQLTPTIAKGNLRIGKINEDGVPLPDTTFKVSYHEDMRDVIGTYTTDSSGYITISGLEPVQVYIQEVSVPDPYVVDSSIQAVTIIGNETVTFTKENRYKKGKIKILKKDVISHQLIMASDVSFAIYTDTNQYVTTIYTDENGIATSPDLRYGNYYFLEVNSSDGYIIDETPQYFEIRNDEQIITKEFYNERVKANIIIEKQDMITQDKPQGEAQLDGAVYGLYAREDILTPDRHEVAYHKDQLIMKKEINQHTAMFEELLLGKYYVKEISPSLGYTLDTAIYPIDCLYEDMYTPIIEKHQIVTERVKSQSFQLIKVSSDGTSGEVPLLEGAEFTIKAKRAVNEYGYDAAPVAMNAKGEPASILITDNKGFAVSEELPYGSYIIKETKTPEGFTPIPDFQVDIKEDNREPMVWRVFNDAVIKAHIKVIKVDEETGKQIPSPFIRFKIRDLSTNEYVKFWIKYPSSQLIDTFETDETGSFTTPEGLPYGKYQIEEIHAPNGYVLDTTPLVFEISNNSAYEVMSDGVSLQILLKKSDPQAKGQIQIMKQAEIFSHVETKETLYGTVYQPIFEKGYLSDVTFDLYAKEDIVTPDGTLWYHANEYIETITTTSDGPEASSLLPLGSYYAKETATKEGYILNDEIYEVTLSYENQFVQIVVESVQAWNDKEQGELTFTKQFEQTHFTHENAIKNTIFGVYTKDKILVDGEEILPGNVLLGVISLDEVSQGHFTFDFAGQYYIKEIQSDPNYIIDETLYEINFTYQQLPHQDISFVSGDHEIENKLKRGSLELQKVNEQNEPLAGVLFELSYEDSFATILQEKRTDQDGKLTFDDLPYGTYYVREKETQDLYVLKEDVQKVMIESNHTALTVINEHRISSIQIRKLDEIKRTPLAGVEFTLYDDFGNAVEVKETNLQGIVVFEHLYNGIYHIRETKALPNYEPLTEDLKVEIKGNDAGRIYEYEITNSYIIQTGLSDNTGFYSVGFVISFAIFTIMIKHGHKNRKNIRERIKW